MKNIFVFTLFSYYCKYSRYFCTVEIQFINLSIISTMSVNNTSEENQVLNKKKSRLGIRLFFVYFFFYAGFVAIGVFQYELLAIPILAGLNLAIVYGIGLIVFAVLLGIVYNHYCSKYEDEHELAEGGKL